MTKYIKFTIGNSSEGYKTVEIFIKSKKVFCKILRSGLLNVNKKNSTSAQISDTWLAEFDALNIFSWEKNYSSDIVSGTQWELTFKDGKKIYHGQGANAYPENWERFLDWLDELVPELEFVNRKRLEKITLNYLEEKLTLDRRKKILTIDKKNSTHTYDLNEDDKNIFNIAQKFFDNAEAEVMDSDSDALIKFELTRHDGSTKIFETLYSENFFEGLTDFIKGIQSIAADLTAEIFSPAPVKFNNSSNKYIFCKVQFTGSYKHYTYRTDDEKLSVGDVVDVPVGRNNDVAQAKIVEIGYFDEYETPYPIDKIKKIIGKHIAADWENY